MPPATFPLLQVASRSHYRAVANLPSATEYDPVQPLVHLWVSVQLFDPEKGFCLVETL